MRSQIREALRLAHEPVALLWSDEQPEDDGGQKALQFAPGRWGCALTMFAQAARGRTAVFDRETAGYAGGAVGIGFGNRYEDYLGGIECFYRFLSSGNEGDPAAMAALEEAGRNMRAESLENFRLGERYMKTPEIAKSFVDSLPTREIPARYVVLKPLWAVDRDREKPVTIHFLADADQLSALIVLANYGRDGTENVTIPMGAGCHSIGILAYREAEREPPRAVVGLVDLSARLNIAHLLEPGLMTFTVPLGMFDEMEENVPGSFLERETWRELMERRNRHGSPRR